MAVLKINWVIPEQTGTEWLDLKEFDTSSEEWSAMSREDQEEALELFVSENENIVAYGKLDSFELIEE